MPDLDSIFEAASCRLPAAGVECLLIGGFAVNHYGYTRNTLDVDFMIVADQSAAVRRVMVEAGFANVAVEANATLFCAPDCPLRVDFLHVDEETQRQLLSKAVSSEVRGYRLNIPSLRDLLAMKVFALSSEPERRLAKDLPDIAYLSVLHDLDEEADLRPLCGRSATATGVRRSLV